MNDQVSGLYKISSLQTLPGGPGRRCTLLGSPVASMRKVAAQGSPDLSSGPTPQSSTLVGAEPTEQHSHPREPGASAGESSSSVASHGPSWENCSYDLFRYRATVSTGSVLCCRCYQLRCVRNSKQIGLLDKQAAFQQCHSVSAFCRSPHEVAVLSALNGLGILV